MSNETNYQHPFNLFGVEISDTQTTSNTKEAYRTAAAEDPIAQVLQEATDEVRSALDRDFSGQVNYSVASPGTPTPTAMAPSRFNTSSSVFRDSGLPRIWNMGQYVESVIPQFSSNGVVPFFGLERNSVQHVWAARNVFQRNATRLSFGNLFRFLMKMDWRESDEWQGNRSVRWVNQHRPPLAFYMTELFAGRFVDRNGTAKSFSLGVDFSDLSQLSNFEISPELAGKIVATLVEFLGDRVFQVPYYAPAILSHYQTHRVLDATITKNDANVELIRAAIEAGTLDSTAAGKLGLPLDGDLDWTVMFKPSGGGGGVPDDPAAVSTIIGSRLCRLLAQRMESLDSGFVEQSAAIAASDVEIGKLRQGTSKKQSRYTIHASGIQSNAMQCIFLPEEAAGCDNSSIGSGKDYADLVGKLVKLAGESAERNVRALIGGIVRGISLFALDNEVVAEVVSSAAAVATKKAAEAFSYSLITRFIANQNIPVERRKEILASWSSIHQRLDGE